MLEFNGQNLVDVIINNERRIIALEKLVTHLVNSGGRVTQEDVNRFNKEAESEVRKKYSAA